MTKIYHFRCDECKIIIIKLDPKNKESAICPKCRKLTINIVYKTEVK